MSRSTVLERCDVEVTVIGAGRSGSQIALVAAMLGFPLRVYDFDRLAPENSGRQIYLAPEIEARREKVVALRVLVRAVVPNAPVIVHVERFEARADQPYSPVLVIAVDSMRERRHIFEELRGTGTWVLLLDARLGNAQVRVHEVAATEAHDLEEYAASLHEDDDGQGPACAAAESTAHAAAAAAALVGGALCAFVDGGVRPRWMAVDLDKAQWCAGARS